jgi:NADH dehydrogenase
MTQILPVVLIDLDLTGHRRVRQASTESLKIYLIETGPRILLVLPERISQAVHRELVRLCVEVVVRKPVREASVEGVLLDDDEVVDANVRIWAGEIKALVFLASLDGFPRSLRLVLLSQMLL